MSEEILERIDCEIQKRVKRLNELQGRRSFLEKQINKKLSEIELLEAPYTLADTHEDEIKYTPRRKITKKWKTVLDYILNSPNHTASLDEIHQYTTACGLALSRNQIVWHIGNFVNHGHIIRIGRELYRITARGAKVTKMDR